MSKYTYPIISDSNADTILSALEVLHGVVQGYGEKKLPDFGAMDAQSYERIAARALAAYKGYLADQKERAIAHIRQGAKDVVEPLVAAHKLAKEEYDMTKEAMPAHMVKLLAPFPTFIEIPISDFTHLFPEGTDVGVVASRMKDMSYTVGKGANGLYVKIPVPFTTGQGATKAA